MRVDPNLMLRRSRRLTATVCIAAGDCLALLFAITVGNLALYILRGTPVRVEYSLLVVPAWFLASFVQRLLPGWGLSVVDELRRIEGSLVLVFGLAAAAVFLGRFAGGASRLNFVLACVTSAFLLPLVRNGLKRLLIRGGLWGQPSVFYGESAFVRPTAEAFAADPYPGFLPVGAFVAQGEREHDLGALPFLGGWDDSVDAPVAVLVAGRLPHATLTRLLDRLNACYPTVILVPDFVDVPSLWVKPLDIAALTAVEISNNLLHAPACLLKRAFELLVVLLLAPLWIPLGFMVLLLLLIVERKTPFFVQERLGRGERPFRALKFRTMDPQAESRLEQALARDAALRTEWEAHGKLRRDPRVTRIGRILRRWSLDELPQFLHVLKGDMALIGPRPLPPYHQERISPGVRALRARVRPGVTGLWQVLGRSASGTEGLERWDAYYVRNWSLWLDLVILARTLYVVLTGHGAY